jgi:exodeoxyribonuclease V beta subunit
MKRERFDLLEFPLDGLRLIEASAGTGKTFSLTGLYLRLLVEKRLDVRQILVMTFTNAATQELRERIRTRLARAARLAADLSLALPGDDEDRVACSIVARAAEQEPQPGIARRLREAAARMDDATISTIHAFAHRAAEENAFDSGMPFDRGEQVDDAAIRQEAIRDYWRRHVFGCAPAECAALRELWPTPEHLARQIGPALAKPHVLLDGPADVELAAAIQRTRELWNADVGKLGALLADAYDADKLLKTGALYKAIKADGGVAAFIGRLEGGLTGTASGHPGLPAWLAGLATDAGAAPHIKVKFRASVRPQDQELVRALATLAPLARLAAIRSALATVRETIRSRKRSARQFSFADMIEALHEAVTDPGRGSALADALHRTWPYALVDEFQDTDPLQYQILDRIYSRLQSGRESGRQTGALVMIGDPKQAIYAFRGGDVFAYLAAARDADGRYELDTNYRSTRGVLAAIDALFRGPAGATRHGEFLNPDIRFHTVLPGRKDGDRVVLHRGKPLPSLTAWAVPGEALTAPRGRAILLDATVTKICELLDPITGARTRAGEADDPVAPGDIAVLVNTNREAADVQRALARRGVPAVCLQHASIFESEEARDLLLVLRAADSAASPEAMRAALTTTVFGLRMGDLLALAMDDVAWQRLVERFQDAHETWRTLGVLALLEPLLQDAASRVLALDDGERRMTNYLQLAELLAQAQSETFGNAGLLRWLGAQIADPGNDSPTDARELRLESDDALVRIVTIHRVKGLEYPIVFVPFLPWLGARQSAPPFIWHDAEGRARLDFGLQGTDHAAAAALESRAEALRLLYVALTRAKQACYVGWGAIRGAQSSAFAWLLQADDIAEPHRIETARSNLPDWLNGATVRARLEAWVERAAGAVRVEPPPTALPSGYRAPFGDAPTGSARSDLPARRPDWSVLSYSRLVAGGRHQEPGSGDDDEAPDPLPHPTAAAEDGAIVLRGSGFGTAVHKILEQTDPADWPAPGSPYADDQLERVERTLANAGMPLGDDRARASLLESVANLVSRTLFTPLPAIGPLARIPADRRLVEMEFFMSLGGGQSHRIVEFLNQHGYGHGLQLARRQQLLNGLMQGFVDLTVEADGRYWIVDYKTNHLGARLEDYRPDALALAVRRGHYDLQYLIYLVALHRHLGRSLHGYDPVEHLGGAQYLFVRGLSGADASTGVHVDSPTPGFIVALDALFAGAA